MTDTTPLRLTLRQRWHRLRTSPRFPFVLFFGLLLAGGLSQVYCFWWDVRIERMLVRNKGTIDRIRVYPPWVRKYLGHSLISRFEPIRAVRMRYDMPESLDARPDDLRLLRGALFLRSLDIFGALSADDSRHLSRLTELRTAHFGSDPEWALDGVEKLPKLTSLQLSFPGWTDPAVYQRVASMPQLERFSFFVGDPALGHENITLGLRELAQSPSLYRLEARLGNGAQLLALTSHLPDGSPPLPELHELCLRGSGGVAEYDLVKLKQLPNLIHLDLSYTNAMHLGLDKLKKELPHLRTLKELPHLRTLYLEGCRDITDEGAAILASMHNLQSLNVKQTGISPAGLLRLATLPRLRCLRATTWERPFRDELRKRLPARCELDTH